MRLIYYAHYIATKVVVAFNFICKWDSENTDILADVNRCIKTKKRLHRGIQSVFIINSQRYSSFQHFP